MVMHEIDINRKLYLNILVGKLSALEKPLVFNWKTLSRSVNSDIITREIDNAVHSLGVARENFCMLLTDAARYMTVAGSLVKKLCPWLFHVTCMDHLQHNCATKVRANCPAVDELVTRVKSLTINNRSKRAFFTSIGRPPQPVVIRWSNWLKAAFYYSRNLSEVRNILVQGFHDSRVLVRLAREAAKAPNLSTQLVEIEEQCSALADMIQKIEGSGYITREAYQEMMSLGFGVDVCQIGKYIQERMSRKWHQVHCENETR